MNSNLFFNLSLAVRQTVSKPFLALSKRALLFMVILLPIICLQGVVYQFTVNYPPPVPVNVRNFDNISAAIHEAVHPDSSNWQPIDEVNIKIYGLSYTLMDPIPIHLENQNAIRTLTIEGANSVPEQYSTLIGASEDVDNIRGRFFIVYLASYSHLTIKHLKFVCNNPIDINTAAINIMQPKGQMDFENNIFDTSGSAIYSQISSAYYSSPFTVNIHHNTFNRVIDTYPSPDFDTIHFAMSYITNPQIINFNISNNNFGHALIPIDLSCYTQITSITNNVFSVPEKAYNYIDHTDTTVVNAWNTVRVYASPHRNFQNGVSQLNFMNNTLTNVSLDISTINSTISNNLLKTVTTQATDYSLMTFDNSNYYLQQTIFSNMQLAIKDNIVFDNSNSRGAVIHLNDSGASPGIYFGSRPIYASIIGNTIFSNDIALKIDKHNTTLFENSHVIEFFRNNLIQLQPNTVTMKFQFFPDTQSTEVHPVSIDHSWFTQGFPTDTANFICDATCGAGDPLINLDMQNFTYSPKWTVNQKSPLIMAGYPEPGQIYYDRKDIGKAQYDERTHAYHEYQFPPHSIREGIKWMSFPTLDRLFVNPVAQDWAFSVFAPLQDPQKLNNIKFKLPGDGEQLISLDGNIFQGQDHRIDPIYGYKFTMYENLVDPVSFPIAGIMPNVSDYPINLYAHQNGKVDPNVLYKNWIGYFVPRTQTPDAAFGNALNNIYSIQTQNWFMVRDHNHQWVSLANNTNGQPNTSSEQPYTLRYGDMVEVTCYTDMVGDDAFHWFTNGTQMEPYEKEALAHFNYKEETEYIPVYVDLEGTNMPKEIGVYLDNICKGGAKVIDKLVKIPAYLLEGLPENKELEFRLYYDTKTSDTIPKYTTMNTFTGIYEDVSIIPTVNDQNSYYRVKIKTNDSNVNPVPKVYLSNYPNPFNSHSTIEYYLPKDSEVSIDIMNVKGQKVNSIVSGFQTMGVHTVNWDGKDYNGKPISSGIYFATMKYKGKQLSQKMIYMK